jgi:flagellar hook protein FlgE
VVDPGYYARVIPRNLDASGLGRKWVHQFEKSNAATTMKSGAFGSSLISVPLSAYLPQHPTACAGDQTFAWKYVQVLSVVDKTAPVIATNVNGGNHPTTTNDCKGDVSFTFKAWDACATNVLTFERATLFATNSPLSIPITNLVRGEYQTKDSTFQVKLAKVPVGNYILKVEIKDDCGNYASRQIPFTVEAAEAPAPVCVQILTASLIAGDNGQPYQRIRAIDFLQDTDRDFNTGSCSPGGFVSIIREAEVKPGYVPRKADSVLILNCNDLGGIPIRVYFTSGSGKVNYCSVLVEVADNNKICESLASIAGEVKTESKAPVEGAEMNLSGEMKMMKPTSSTGKYELSNLTAKKDYTVTPSLNKDYLNGVSTFDLVAMQRHILDSRKLDSPYKLIAADINNSKTITVLDMIQLRRLILGINTKFENNSSWRFIPADYVFPNPANPWQESFPEVKNFNNLIGKANIASFVGIKMGDLNGSVVPNTVGGQIRNFVDKVTLNLSEMKLEAGETKKVSFSLENMKDIEGIQFTMEFDKSSLELIDVVNEIAQDEHVAIFGDENLMTVSWNGSVREGALFHLVLRAKKPAYLSEAIQLNDRITKKEAYINGKLHDVVPGFKVNQDGQVYALYQNVPNPFTDETIIGFQLPVSERGTLEIQDASGRVVKVFESEFRKGYNQQKVKLADLKGPGVYFYKLNTANYSESRSFILIR